MDETIIIVKWLLVFTATSLVGSLMFVSENSKMLRYTIGKAVGIIALAGITWLLSLGHILPFTSASVWAVLIILYALTLFFRRKYIQKFVKDNYRQILLIEAVVLGLFIALINIRMLTPKIEGIEKFMDIAILTGLMRHDKGVPLDTWYAPSSINYYYFGHWIVACWSKLSFISANYAFNLGFASILSLVGGMIFAIVHKLSGKIWAGFIGIFLALFASNLYAFLYIVKIGGVIDFFKTGRFVDEVINEYPLYSVYLGDLHAHMLGLLLSVALFGIVTVTASETGKQQKLFGYAIIGILLGLMVITNSFDIINCGVLLAYYFLWELSIRKMSLKAAIRNASLIIVPFVALLLVSVLTFKPAVSGIQVSIFKTPLIHIFWQFGAMFALIATCCIAILLQPNLKSFVKKIQKSYQFMVVIFAITALTLIVVTELLYFKDIYHYANPPYARANTQFKIWYSAWIMLAIAGASIFGIALSHTKKTTNKAIIAIVGLAILAVASAGTFAGYSHNRNLQESYGHTINGTKYIQVNEPDKLAMINYVNKNILGQPIILQNGGDSYSKNSWLTSYTGTAAYLGWRSHEWGWRYSNDAWAKISIKDANIKQAYEANTVQEFSRLINIIGADFVLVGPDETGLFNVNKAIINTALGQPVFSSGDYYLYKVNN